MNIILTRLIKNLKQWWQTNPLYGEQFMAWGRLLFLLFSIPGIALLAIKILEGVDPLTVADQIKQDLPILHRIPSWLVMFLVPLTNWYYARYLLAPLGAFLLVFLAGVLYVKDTYDLEDFLPVFRYVFSSMFGLFYPTLAIDGGEIKITESETNTLKEIGGPGFAMIQPGNAVIFRNLRQPSKIILPQTYFLKPFEMIDQIADLDDQHDFRDEIWAVTLDGIQLHLQNINYRYRLLTTGTDGTPRFRTPHDPYPFSEEAMQDMAYNLSAGESWQKAVRRIIGSEITDFISTHKIDYLTAPRLNNQNPRHELRTRLLAQSMRNRLRTIGTELLWIDIGHLDIMEISDMKQENVDSQRFAYWASRWIGNINQTHAYGEANRLALQERGRVEAQVELLQNITEALHGFEQTGNPAENLRKMLLVRTAQILDGMGETNHIQEDKKL